MRTSPWDCCWSFPQFATSVRCDLRSIIARTNLAAGALQIRPGGCSATLGPRAAPPTLHRDRAGTGDYRGATGAHQQSHRVGGFTFFARALQQRLDIDYVHSNELEISDGLVTGRVTPPIVNGARKAALLAEIADREGISLERVVAVGDGANDIPMLNLAGMGIAYRAKRVVRQNADQSISCLGLDGLLYLLGVPDRDLQAHGV